MSITFQAAVWKVAILIGNMEHLDGKRRILIIGENGGGKKIKGNFFYRFFLLLFFFNKQIWRKTKLKIFFFKFMKEKY